MTPRVLLATISLLSPAACAPFGPAADPDDPAYGRALYEENCVVCHGSGGAGDGELASSLNQKPADLRTIAARNGGVFDKNKVMSAIFAADKNIARTMPEFGDQDLGDIIIVEHGGLGTPVYVDLLALANYLEGIQE